MEKNSFILAIFGYVINYAHSAEEAAAVTKSIVEKLYVPSSLDDVPF
jgi:hypothetical protein